MRRDGARSGPADAIPAGTADHRAGATVDALFPIRVVSRLTGINPVTIRAWERRYRLVLPARTPGGHRLYSRADVELLRAASRLVDQGISISRATRQLAEPLQGHGAGEDATLEHLLERLAALDDDGMRAVLDAFVARHSGDQATALLDRLPAAAASLPALERQWLDGWLEGLLAFRIHQRMTRPDERRVLVCCPALPGTRSWALAFALGLVESGVRPMLLAAPSRADLFGAVRRARCAAVVLHAAPGGLPGAAELGVPTFCGDGAAGMLPLAGDLALARQSVLEALGRDQTPRSNGTRT